MDGDRRETTVRRLPDGHEHAIIVGGLTGRLLRAEVPPDGAMDITPGVLVRIDGPETIYLGQVYTREGGRLVVAVEHTVDRHTLAAIREIWSPGR